MVIQSSATYLLVLHREQPTLLRTYNIVFDFHVSFHVTSSTKDYPAQMTNGFTTMKIQMIITRVLLKKFFSTDTAPKTAVL